MTIAIVVGVIFLFLILYAMSGIRIVRPYQRGIVEFLGRYTGTADPGLRLIVPLVQTLRLVDMREQVVDVPPQEVITSDNVVVSVDAVVYYEPTDPQRLVYNVANFILAVTKLAQTNLRNLVGDMQLDEALTSRDAINTHLRQILDDATDKWGVRVVRVEIQRIDPPPDVMHAMHEQMKAERTRRALVTQATGDREAAITRAEGHQQATILASEADRQQQVLRAQGLAEATKAIADADKYRRIALADGEAQATRTVFKAIHDGGATADVLALKYFEALQKVADGQATKIFLPAGADGLMGQLAGVAELLRAGENAPAPARTAGGNGAPPAGHPRPAAARRVVAVEKSGADEPALQVDQDVGGDQGRDAHVAVAADGRHHQHRAGLAGAVVDVGAVGHGAARIHGEEAGAGRGHGRHVGHHGLRAGGPPRASVDSAERRRRPGGGRPSGGCRPRGWVRPARRWRRRRERSSPTGRRPRWWPPTRRCRGARPCRGG